MVQSVTFLGSLCGTIMIILDLTVLELSVFNGPNALLLNVTLAFVMSQLISLGCCKVVMEITSWL